MNKTNEQKANEFLQYIANNLTVIKHTLRKNITFDEDIFEDSISEAIIKVHTTIMKNGTAITDFKQYFFIAAKFTYIYNQNKKRKKEQAEINLFNSIDNFDIEEEENDIEVKFKELLNRLSNLKEHITEVFGEYKTNMYWGYMTAKASEWTSYNKYSQTNNINEKELRQITKEIRTYINENKEYINTICQQ